MRREKRERLFTIATRINLSDAGADKQVVPIMRQSGRKSKGKIEEISWLIIVTCVFKITTYLFRE